MAGASDCLSVRLKIVQHQYFFIDHANCPGAKLKPPGFLLLPEQAAGQSKQPDRAAAGQSKQPDRAAAGQKKGLVGTQQVTEERISRPCSNEYMLKVRESVDSGKDIRRKWNNEHTAEYL